MTDPVHSYKPQLAVTDDLKALVLSLEARVGQLEGGHNFRLTLLAVFPGLGTQEHKVHTLLKGRNTKCH